MDERWNVNLKCPKCGTSYVDAVKEFSGVGQGPAVKYVAPPLPGGPPDVTEHLRVTCLFCGFARDIPCADAPRPEPATPAVPTWPPPPPPGRGNAPRPEPATPAVPRHGEGPPPEPPGVNETPATGAFANDPNVSTRDVPLDQGKGHLGPAPAKKSK